MDWNESKIEQHPGDGTEPAIVRSVTHVI